MDDPPAPPTSGNTNFTQGILLFTIILTTLSATVAGLRFATRAWIVKGLGWDDYTMMFAVVSPATLSNISRSHCAAVWSHDRDCFGLRRNPLWLREA